MTKFYSDYLQSAKWKTRATQTKRDHPYCAKCGSVNSLNCHHLSYAHIGNESDDELIVLCKTCHERTHGIGKVSWFSVLRRRVYYIVMKKPVYPLTDQMLYIALNCMNDAKRRMEGQPHQVFDQLAYNRLCLAIDGVKLLYKSFKLLPKSHTLEIERKSWE